MYECAVLMRICSQRKYDKFLLSIANHAKDTSPDGDLEMDTVEAAMFRQKSLQPIDKPGGCLPLQELFHHVEHELRPSPIELRTLRYVFNTYSFRDGVTA